MTKFRLKWRSRGRYRVTMAKYPSRSDIRFGARPAQWGLVVGRLRHYRRDLTDIADYSERQRLEGWAFSRPEIEADGLYLGQLPRTSWSISEAAAP